MTSGIFHNILVASVVINREKRQRRELTGIDEMAESIQRIGLINPPVVRRDNHELVAGERRFTAILKLGWTHMPVQYVEDLDEEELYAIELEENIKRVDLSWQDQVRALEEYHRLRKAKEPSWSQSDTAKAVGLKQQTVSDQLAVAQKLTADPRVATAPKFSVAKNIVVREKERQQQSAEIALRSDIATPEEKSVAKHRIVNASFLEWAPTYRGPKFNLIHCDFPYGINADGFAQGQAAAHGGYADTPEVYWNLLQCLADNLDNFCAESAHLMFWFSMTYYTETVEFLRSRTDFIIDPFPLIWYKSDNHGILPDPQRGPRRLYETALFGRRGDRKVVQAVANAFPGPTVRDRHMSEKPVAVLGHFYRMLVDQTSRVLDPTAGSGSAIRAAESAGADFSLGLELNPEFAKRAQLALTQARIANKETSNGTPQQAAHA